MQPFTIIVADADSIYRGGMTKLLQENFLHCTIIEADCADALPGHTQHTWFDVMLIDVHLPHTTGFTAASRLLQQCSEYRIILYAHTRDKQLMMQAFEAGASAFFYSHEAPAGILYKIEQVVQNGCCITTETFEAYKTARRNALNADPEKVLTRREKEVLLYLKKGYINKQIAEQMKLSIKTVENHRGNLMRKTNSHNVAQLLLYVQENGLMRDDMML